jgi:NTP pyrophosphatase (non-canonical NTP hydrolase)
MNVTELTKIQQIADTYGFEQQREMIVEECSELIQAVQKLKRADNSGDAERIDKATSAYLEEMADVSIMLEQMRYMLTPRLKQELDSYISMKIDRQIERIEQAKKQEKEQYDKWRAGVQA